MIGFRPYYESSRRNVCGFTIVELLIVIAIIGVLVALLLPVISGALQKGRRAAELVEIKNNLQTAMEQFKERFGVYPPSQMILREDGAYTAGAVPVFGPMSPPIGGDQRTAVFLEDLSIQYLSRMFPQMIFNRDGTALNSTSNQADLDQDGTFGSAGDFYDWNGDGIQNGPWFLQGDECLVFFLGGIPMGEAEPNTAPGLRQGSGAPGVMGFGKDPSNPARNPSWLAQLGVANATEMSNREGPFFEFSSGRLMDRDADHFYEYIPKREFGDIPYAYFSSYEGAGYRPDDLNLEFEGNGDNTVKETFGVLWNIDTANYPDGNNYPDPTVNVPGGTALPNIESWAPNPYTIGEPYANTPGWVPRYHLPNGFQIISASSDLSFGPGGEYPLHNSPTKFISSDNIANFAEDELGIAEHVEH